MSRATVTLILLIVILSTRAQSSMLPSARIAAQDAPTATIDSLPTAAAAPTAAQVAIETPTIEPAATTEPAAPATVDLAPTTTPIPAATSTPEPAVSPSLPLPTEEPVPTTEEPVPTMESTAEGTATQTPELMNGTPIIQPDESAASEAPPLTLSVAAEEVRFGRVSATGELDPAITGLASAADDRGASYVLAGAVAISVSAGVPWTGACGAAENAGTAATVEVAAGRLEWRLAGTTTWTPFSPSAPDPGCFPGPELGMRTFVYDLRLRVEAGDPPGTFQTVIVFTIEP